jgi:hypothetical protein
VLYDVTTLYFETDELADRDGGAGGQQDLRAGGEGLAAALLDIRAGVFGRVLTCVFCGNTRTRHKTTAAVPAVRRSVS